jgi:hypothetical protein
MFDAGRHIPLSSNQSSPIIMRLPTASSTRATRQPSAWSEMLSPSVRGYAPRTVSTWSKTSYNTTVAGVSPLVQGLGSSRGRR